MPKNSRYRWIDPPAWRRECLRRWLAEWQLYRRLRGVAPADALRMKDGPEARTAHGVRLVTPFDDKGDRAPRAGQIRLLSPMLTPEADRPIYVAVLSDWEDGMKLVAPYAPFAQPATPGELLTGRQASALLVLSVWNTHSVSTDDLSKSWWIDDMASFEREEAWALFRHVTTGAALPAAIVTRVGAPVGHPGDPRRTYQSEEIHIMNTLARATEAWVSKRFAAPATPNLGKDFDALLAEFERMLDLLGDPDAGIGSADEMERIFPCFAERDSRMDGVLDSKKGELALAAATEGQSAVVVLQQGARPLAELRLGRGVSIAPPATLASPPRGSVSAPGRADVVWKLAPGSSAGLAGCRFLVWSQATGRFIGAGRVDADARYAGLIAGRWENFRDNPPKEWILILVPAK